MIPEDTGADASSLDAEVEDANVADADPSDTGMGDANVGDADLVDADLVDADLVDSSAEDAAPEDSGVEDAMSSDAGADPCDAFELSVGGMVPGTTVDFGNDFEPEGDDCPLLIAVSGPDRAYSFTVPDSQTYRVTVAPVGDFNPMVYVREACSAEGICVESGAFGGPGENEVVDLRGEGMSFSIIVDTDITAGPETSGGAYTIGVEVR